MLRALALILAFVIAAPAFAVQPDEVLDDPALEARARALSQELRCVVCRGENIDESNAGIARDIRILLRERLKAGDSDQQVLDFMVERYGEYVLMRPTAKGANLFLWVAGPLMLLAALFVAFGYIRARSRASEREAAVALSPEEAKRLEELLED